jgi:hypothetical protein
LPVFCPLIAFESALVRDNKCNLGHTGLPYGTAIFKAKDSNPFTSGISLNGWIILSELPLELIPIRISSSSTPRLLIIRVKTLL